MQSLVKMLVALALASLLLVSAATAGPVPGASSSRSKRQSADVKTAEYLAWIALGGRVPSQGCVDVACGVVDVYASGKRKRSGDVTEEQRYNLLRGLIEKAAAENMPQ